MDREQEFRALVGQYQARVFRVAWNVLRDRDAALDVAQEVFLALWQQRRPRSGAAVAAWLHRAATNRAIDWLRRRRPAAGAVEAVELLSVADGEDAAIEERRRLIRTALARLSARQREVVTMRILDGDRFAAIARTLGISQGAAKSHFQRGLLALVTLLAPLREAETPLPGTTEIEHGRE